MIVGWDKTVKYNGLRFWFNSDGRAIFSRNWAPNSSQMSLFRCTLRQNCLAAGQWIEHKPQMCMSELELPQATRPRDHLTVKTFETRLRRHVTYMMCSFIYIRLMPKSEYLFYPVRLFVKFCDYNPARFQSAFLDFNNIITALIQC